MSNRQPVTRSKLRLGSMKIQWLCDKLKGTAERTISKENRAKQSNDKLQPQTSRKTSLRQVLTDRYGEKVRRASIQPVVRIRRCSEVFPQHFHGPLNDTKSNTGKNKSVGRASKGKNSNLSVDYGGSLPPISELTTNLDKETIIYCEEAQETTCDPDYHPTLNPSQSSSAIKLRKKSSPAANATPQTSQDIFIREIRNINQNLFYTAISPSHNENYKVEFVKIFQAVNECCASGRSENENERQTSMVKFAKIMYNIANFIQCRHVVAGDLDNQDIGCYSCMMALEYLEEEGFISKMDADPLSGSTHDDDSGHQEDEPKEEKYFLRSSVKTAVPEAPESACPWPEQEATLFPSRSLGLNQSQTSHIFTKTEFQEYYTHDNGDLPDYMDAIYFGHGGWVSETGDSSSPITSPEPILEEVSVKRENFSEK